MPNPQAASTAWSEAGLLPFRVVSAPLTGCNFEAWLGTVLALDAPLVVIDLPPMLGNATAAALAIADLAVVPVSSSGADLRATNRAVELIREAPDARRDGCPKALLVPSTDRGSRPSMRWRFRV